MNTSCRTLHRGLLAIPFLLVAVGIAHAGDVEKQGKRQPVFEITHYPTLGGTRSAGHHVNERGQVAGFSQLPGDQVRHAVLWPDDDTIIDLGALGGPDAHSNVEWPGQNNRGMIVGISQTAEPDPEDEDWSCSAFFPNSNDRSCVGFLWKDGEMTPLPTLGGPNGFATGVNSRGQIVGWAENEVRDDTCVEPQEFQFRAALWEERRGRITVRELPPLGNDTSSAATAINERGQAVGISGICDDAVGKFSALRSVLWDHRGRPHEIPNLGGDSWHTPMAINNRGDVVGFSNPPRGPDDEPGAFIAHAFLWTKHDGIRDLGTLPGDAFSQGQAINSRGQIVGTSFGGAAGFRAFLWEDGTMMDLNDLAESDYTGTLLTARHINDRGQITGMALDSSGQRVAYLATPIERGRGR